MQIEIKSGEVKTKAGKSARTGRDYSIREQVGYLHGVGAYPVECRLNVPDDSTGYAPGVYEVTKPLAVGEYGRLIVPRDLGLQPVKAASRAA